MQYRFNPPPYWPQPPENWKPIPGWRPDPAWGEAPVGWPLWVPATDDDLPDPAAAKKKAQALPMMISVIICCFVGLLVYYGMKALKADELLQAGGFTLVGAVKKVRDWLDRIFERSGITQPDPIPAFGQSWGLRFVYGTLSYYAAVQAGGVVVGLVARSLGSDDIVGSLTSVTLLVSISAFILVGFSAGARVAGAAAYLVTPAVSVAGVLLGDATTALIFHQNAAGAADLRAQYPALLEPQSIAAAVLMFLVLAVIFGTLGTIAGRRRREPMYVAWAARNTKPGDRQQILSAATRALLGTSSKAA